MAFTVVQTVPFSVATNHASENITLSATTVGNLILVAIENKSLNTITSVTDNQSNTYTQRANVAMGAGNGKVYLYDSVNTANGSVTQVTVNFGGTAAASSVLVREYSGGITNVDVTKTGSGNSGAPSTGSSTATSQAVELVVGVQGNTANISQTVGSGFGNLTDNVANSTDVAIEDLTTSTTGTQNAVFGTSVSGGWGALLATYYASGGGGGGSAPTISTAMMMGV